MSCLAAGHLLHYIVPAVCYSIAVGRMDHFVADREDVAAGIEAQKREGNTAEGSIDILLGFQGLGIHFGVGIGHMVATGTLAGHIADHEAYGCMLAEETGYSHKVLQTGHTVGFVEVDMVLAGLEDNPEFAGQGQDIAGTVALTLTELDIS